MSDILLEQMMAAAAKASAAIMDVYAGDFEAIAKSDGSPVTLADEKAEAIIIAELASTGLPVLGEESVAAGRIPELGNRYFVVDPLDGTKEFIKRNGEFTVNIALVENDMPQQGVVLAPALGKAYAGGPDGAHAYGFDGSYGTAQPLRVTRDGPMHIVASRSHGHAALAPLCELFAVEKDVSVGSSLKFCLVAEGTARLYPRFTPTCEWDTAAGQAVLQAAGGAVVTIDGSPLRCGKVDKKFYNPFFAAADSEELAVRVAAEMARLVPEAV